MYWRMMLLLVAWLCDTGTSSSRGVNYASAYLGAKVVEHHPLAVGAQNVLKDDPEKYLIVPCKAERKSFTFGLSKEIEVHAVSLLNLEYFSSSVHNFTLLGSRTYPCRQPQCSWRVLGAFAAKLSRNPQHFSVPRKPPVRFVRFLWVTHQGVEQSCTLTSIQVFGSDVLETLVAELADQYEQEGAAAQLASHDAQGTHLPRASSLLNQGQPSLRRDQEATGTMPAARAGFTPACNGTWCMEAIMKQMTCPLPKPKSLPLTVLNRQLHSLQNDISRLQKALADQRLQVERLQSHQTVKVTQLETNLTDVRLVLSETQRRLLLAEYELAVVRDALDSNANTAQLVSWIAVSNVVAVFALVCVYSGRFTPDNFVDR